MATTVRSEGPVRSFLDRRMADRFQAAIAIRTASHPKP